MSEVGGCSTGFFRGVKGDFAVLNRRHFSPLKKVALILGNRGFHAVMLYRLSHVCTKRRISVLPTLFTRTAQTLFAVDISPRAELGPGIVLLHCFGIVIGAGTQMEGECVIAHGVTLGDKGTQWVGSDEPDGHPYVEKGVMFGAGAKVLGPIYIGAHSVIGANAVVLKDVPAHGIAVGNPARIVGETGPHAYFGTDRKAKVKAPKQVKRV